MDSNLDSILSGTASAPAPEVTETTTPVVEVTEQTEQTQATGEPEAAPPAAEPHKDDPLEKHRKGLEAAAAAERKRRQDAEARAQQLERELQALRQPPSPPAPQPSEDKPLRSQYESEDEWLDARDAWRDRQRERQQQEAKQQEQARTLYEKTEGIYAKAQALEGFDRASFDRLPLTKQIVEALIESEQAPELMRYMASNPEDVYRIAGLSAAKQYQELARIEDKLSAAPPPPPPEAKAKPQLPQTLTQARNAQGRFEATYSGPTPLNAILATK